MRYCDTNFEVAKFKTAADKRRYNVFFICSAAPAERVKTLTPPALPVALERLRRCGNDGAKIQLFFKPLKKKFTSAKKNLDGGVRDIWFLRPAGGLVGVSSECRRGVERLFVGRRRVSGFAKDHYQQGDGGEGAGEGQQGREGKRGRGVERGAVAGHQSVGHDDNGIIDKMH